MYKRIMSVVVVLVSTLILMHIGFLCQKDLELKSDPKLYGTLDEEGRFHISSQRDLEWFFYYVKEGYPFLDAVLEADIDVEYDNAYYAGNYSGHFDGQGYSISKIKTQLFIKLEENAKVENLRLKEANISFPEEVGAAGIAYYNYGKIINCQVSGKIKGWSYVGGIAAQNYGLIKDCVNYADIFSIGNEKTSEWQTPFLAGGIAGTSGTTRKEPINKGKNMIENCINYGSVTGKILAAGICARVEDKTNEGNYGEDWNFPKGMHFSIKNSKNYGTVMVEEHVDVNQDYTNVAGICADLYYGNLYHCANLGKVLISEEAPKISNTGWLYSNQPMAIQCGWGISTMGNYFVVDCVSLKDSVSHSMRHENIMELTEEEMVMWEEGKLPYLSNSWKFDLEQAVDFCSLEPLGVKEQEVSLKESNYYLCDDFAFYLPEGFQIEEKYINGTCYALRIWLSGEVQSEFEEPFEAWLLRKTADVEKALTLAKETEDTRIRGFFMEEIYKTLPNLHILSVESVINPHHQDYVEINSWGKRIFLESSMSPSSVYDSMRDGDKKLGNIINLPLEGNMEDGLEAKWILLMTNSENNVRPSSHFVTLIENGFYPLSDKETVIPIKIGDSLWRIAEKYTGDGNNWNVIADANDLNALNIILPETILYIPNLENWNKKTENIREEWFSK